MQKFALSLVASAAALAALALWSFAWVQWYDPSLVHEWIQSSSEGTIALQAVVGFFLLGFAKDCSNRAETSLGQVLFIAVTGAWGLLALCAGMNLLPVAWLANAPSSSQAILIFLAGCLSLTQAARATATLNGEVDDDEEEEAPDANKNGEAASQKAPD